MRVIPLFESICLQYLEIVFEFDGWSLYLMYLLYPVSPVSPGIEKFPS